MGVGSYLRLKGRASVFRRKVPKGLRARLARTEICATLGIVSRDSAERGARQVAVAVDAFFDSAVRDMNLNSADLSRVVAATIQAWRENDERQDARFVLAHGRALGSPRENALHLAEMAEMALAAHGAGASLHDVSYIERRFAEAGIELGGSRPIPARARYGAVAAGHLQVISIARTTTRSAEGSVPNAGGRRSGCRMGCPHEGRRERRWTGIRAGTRRR